MRTIVLAGFVVSAVFLAPNLGAARLELQNTQTHTPFPPQSNSNNQPSSNNHGNDVTTVDPTAAVRQAQVARLQNNDRQKRIVTDTDKLLRLATELKEEVDKSNKDQLSLDVIRKADEVERLAHDVKLRMRG